jgi:16S rRNA (uracil1498-N3)-methyltransferase
VSRRLFVAPPKLRAGILEVTDDDHHYLFRVLRLRPGDPIVLFDGDGRQADAVVAAIESERAELTVGEPVCAPAPSGSAISVLLPLLKADRSGDCIARLVELGASRIVPVQTRRSVVRVDGERAASRHTRLLSQARQAARQSQSPFVPEVEPIATWEESVSRACEELKLAFWEMAEMPLGAALPEIAPSSIAIAFGPEGGLEEGEAHFAQAAGFHLVSLGPRILRAETAPVAVCAVLGFVFGDVG